MSREEDERMMPLLRVIEPVPALRVNCGYATCRHPFIIDPTWQKIHKCPKCEQESCIERARAGWDSDALA